MNEKLIETLWPNLHEIAQQLDDPYGSASNPSAEDYGLMAKAVASIRALSAPVAGEGGEPVARPEGMDVYLALLAKEIQTQRRNAAAMPNSSSHWAAQADWLERIYDYLRAAPSASREAELERQVESLREVLEKVTSTATILQQNSVACAVRHHGLNTSKEGLPGWLADCEQIILRARTALQVQP